MKVPQVAKRNKEIEALKKAVIFHYETDDAIKREVFENLVEKLIVEVEKATNEENSDHQGGE